MARPATSTRLRINSLPSLDIAWLCRQDGRGSISWSRKLWGGDEERTSASYRVERAGLRLWYRVADRGGELRDVDQLIPIATTAMRFGGARRWFACPCCSRRCRIIYRGGASFRCRLCWSALYASQYESTPLRISGLRWRIRHKVVERGGQTWPLGGLDGPFPSKPPRMQWRTYRQLEARDEELRRRWHAAIGAWLKRTDPQRPRCGVPTRNGLPCRQWARRNGRRCSLHGRKARIANEEN